MNTRLMPALLALIGISCLAHPSRADSFWEIRVGAKGALTGNLWAEPNEAPARSDPFWGDDQFFVGGGGGIFAEVNFFGFVGLELDLLFEANSLTFNETINYFEYDYDTHFTQLRVPILVKGTVPLGPVELSLGIGPEFVVGLSADVGFEIHTALSAAQKAQALAQLEGLYGAEKANGTFLDLDLGVSISVWKLFIPIDLRAGINLDQSENYPDRVDLAGNRATVKAIESFHFSLQVGVGWVF
ncbi:MAG: hypothetical protein JXR96_26210 [Deltaproteobacteria bacterium]|nr:hypothetical protein [Deltaproteobacteria bacterium]